MRSRSVLPLILIVLAAVAVAGCGEDEKDKFIDDYKPLNDRLLAVGRDLEKELAGAEDESNKELSRQFAGLALRLEAISKQLRALDTPDDLRDESDVLALRIDDTTKNLNDISGAAATGDPQGAATATVELATNSRALNRAQNRLARATGAKIGRE